MPNSVFKYGLACLFYFCTIALNAQELPLPPDIKYVSVTNAEGDIQLAWHPTTDLRTDGYILFYIHPIRQTRLELDTITSVLDTTAILKYELLEGLPSTFTIASYILVGDELADGNQAFPHKAIQIDYKYIACDTSVLLNWNAYEGWDSIVGYEVYANDELIGFTENTSFRFKEVDLDMQYEFYVLAHSAEGYKSFSYREQFVYTEPQFPELILIAGICQQGNELNISFFVDEPNQVSYYILFNHIEIDPIDTLPSSVLGNVFVLQEDEHEPEDALFVGAFDYCGNLLLSSNEIRRMSPMANRTGRLVQVCWNKPVASTSIDYTYEILRLGNEITSIGTTTDTCLLDELSDNLLIKPDVSYRVLATVSKTFPETVLEGLHCASADVKIGLEDNLKVPEAFTPNNDNVNDVFFPITEIFPSSYSLAIYNKWGHQIFETHVPEGWDGQLPDGTPAGEDVYMYFLKIVLPDGQEISKSGRIFVVYP